MFSKIPEISLNSTQTSSQSVTGSQNPSPGGSKTASHLTKPGTGQHAKPGTGQHAKPGTVQQIKPVTVQQIKPVTGQQTKPGTGQQAKSSIDQKRKSGTSQQTAVEQKALPKEPPNKEDQNISKQTKSALSPNSASRKTDGSKPKTSFKEVNQVPSSIVEEIDTNVNPRLSLSGLSGAIVQMRQYSGTSSGRTKSPDMGVSVGSKLTSMLLDQATRRFSVTSLPSVEPQQTNRPSLGKATSAVTASERVADQFLRRMSITSTHSGERRFSAGSPSRRSSTEAGSEEARRMGIDYNQQRRRSSRESRRRASLILVGSNYRVGRKIGAGNFGELRLGKNLATDEIVAIKLEPMSARFSQLRREYVIYKRLGQPPVEGIPAVYFWSTCLSYNALVMELLGPNLAELFELCNQKFTLKTVLLIALQTIRRIQFVHSKSILYRDVKPENFLIGRMESKRQVIYLLDFGLAKEYIDPDTREHIPFRENKGITGTARYISINMHQGKEMSRRDDLEALGYMLIYFLKGRLPWQGQHLGNDMDALRAVSNIKMRTPIEKLCEGHPREFTVYLQYVRALGFFDSPDYDFLSSLFQGLLESMEIPCDWNFDWMNHTLHVTPSGMLLTKLVDHSRVDGGDEPFVDRTSSGERGSRFQSNKAMMSYDNLLRDLSLNVSAEKEAINEYGADPTLSETKKDKSILSKQTSLRTECIFCYCCGVCCIHRRTDLTNRVSPI